LSRRLRDSGKRAFLTLHKFALRRGLAIVPNHYYSGVPDLNQLARTRQWWARKSAMTGIDCDLDGQAARLREICARFEPEYRGNRVYQEASRSESGPGFGYIEAQVLHAVTRYFKPPTVIEVGSGVSTRCMLAAVELNSRETGRGSRVVCIEPFPRPWLHEAPVELLAQPVQMVPLDRFEGLEPGSLFSIDSSHTVRTGSDVNYLILEVLPRLRPGTIVHFHDIYFPYDYPRDALNTLSNAQETALLHAYLIGNRSVRTLFSMSQLHYDRRELLRELFAEYRPQLDTDGLRDQSYGAFEPINEHFPSSTYLEITG
jgi:hypothetical protein